MSTFQSMRLLDKRINARMKEGLESLVDRLLAYNYSAELQDYLDHEEDGAAHILITMMALERILDPDDAEDTRDHVKREFERRNRDTKPVSAGIRTRKEKSK